MKEIEVYKQTWGMLLILAGVIQTLLVLDCVLRRLLMVFLPVPISPLERYANATLLSTLAAACFNAALIPFQAAAGLLAALNRYIMLGLLFMAVFTVLLVLSPNAVYVFSSTARIYNLSVTPFVAAMRVLLIFADLFWRSVAPPFNGFVFFGSQILRRIVVPLSQELVVDIADMLKLVVLALGAFGRAVLVWAENVWNCTGGFVPRTRLCGVPSATSFDTASDCGSVFMAADARCYASTAHFELDLVTPGLYLRSAARVLQGVVEERCPAPALVLNILIFPLTDYQIYLSAHAFVNTFLHTMIALPVQTIRRCEAVRSNPRVGEVAKAVACTPDFDPLFDKATTALQSLGLAVDAWLNFMSLQLSSALGGTLPTCNGENLGSDNLRVQLGLEHVVLDAARAIEGRTRADLEILAGRGGLPRSETLAKVRVVGLTSRLIAVTDGLNVLYRSVYDGSVFAYGAFPYPVDVRAGLAAVPYTTHSVGEADPFGDSSTGLLGCACRDAAAGIVVHCATAPYLSHVEDDEAAFNATAAHRVDFPGLSLAGMTCGTTVVRVLPMRWPRQRLARAGSHGQGVSSDGYSGYTRPSVVNTGRNWRDFFTGDEDAVDSLRDHANVRRTARVNGVVAGVYVTPVCGGNGPGGQAALRCAEVDDNCYPYCLGLVKAGVRSQNITMHNAKRWAESVVLPDVDCGVGRDRGGECDESNPSALPLVEVAGALKALRCPAEKRCMQSAAVSSIIPLAALATDGGDDVMSRLQKHNSVFGALRRKNQPAVVTGDTMLVVSLDETKLVVVRLYDVGRSSMQMAAERLTSTVNAHAASINTVCYTQDDVDCVVKAMKKGEVVLPPSFAQIGSAGAQASRESVPAASSRFAVHFAANPELGVLQAYFQFCNSGTAVLAPIIASSYGRARVWTVQTTRAVDLEGEGEPNEAEVASRVSYMRIPDFIEVRSQADAIERCDVIVGLRIVGVEYLNAQNVLVTVLAGRPRDYDPLVGDLTGPRHYRYYFLHPQQHDCVDEKEGAGRAFTCWRAESAGQFPDDRVVSDAVGSGLCPEQRPLPAFGTAAVLPVVAVLAAVQVLLDSVCALTAAAVVSPGNPAAAVLELRTLDLRGGLTFHGMVDSGGGRLFDVDPFLNTMTWLSNFGAGLMIFSVDAFISVTGLASAGRVGERTIGGLRTFVVGTARVQAGSPMDFTPFKEVEVLFSAPLHQVSSQAAIAVLTSTDGVAGFSLPGAVRLLARTQIGMASQAELVLRLGRDMAMRVLESSAAILDGKSNAAVAVGGIMSAALVDARALIGSAFLDTMRSQCHGLTLSLGQQGSLAQSVFHACMVLPDTLEGCLSVFAVLVSEYPAVQCVCKLAQGEASTSGKPSNLALLCLGHENAVAQQAWIQDMQFRTTSSNLNKACFAAMDGANSRLRSAFDKALRRLYMLGQHAGSAADSALSMITGDSVACDAFDISPYVLSIIPEPIDYFMHCADTADCRTRCLPEFDAFEEANRSLAVGTRVKIGLDEKLTLPVDSLLFGMEDLVEGRAAPPFQVQDAAELSPAACAVVCGAASDGAEKFPNRCLLVAGAGRGSSGNALPATAYYCLPIDMMQHVREWVGQPLADQGYSLQSALETGAATEQLLAVHILSTWAPGTASENFARDALIAVVRGGQQSRTQSEVRLLLLRVGFPARVILLTDVDEKVARVAVDLADAEAVSFTQGWMSSIERVEVRPSAAAGQAAEITVFGWREFSEDEERHWRRACLLGSLALEETGLVGGLETPWKECTEVSRSSYAPENLEDYKRDAGGRDWNISETHFDVCVRSRQSVSSDCLVNLRVPHTMPESGEARLEISIGKGSPRKVKVSSLLLSTLGADQNFGTYLDMGGGVNVRVSTLARVHYSASEELAAILGGETQTLPLLLANGRDAGAWLHVFELALPGRKTELANAEARQGLRAETRVQIRASCSVQNCAACGQTTDRSRRPELVELENACYGAQACAVARCAGTLVNLRKPLCNLGSVLASEIHGARVVLQSCWILVADSVGAVVELTQQRRHKFEIAWPDEAVRSLTCVGKDAIVSVSATLTSIFGAMSVIMMDVPTTRSTLFVATDPRVHARYIMALASFTNCIAAILMAPIYTAITVQKVMSCTLNDVSATLQNFVVDAQSLASGGESSGNQLGLVISFGSTRVQKLVDDSGVATCLSEDIRQLVADTMAKARSSTSSSQAELPPNLITLVGGFLSDMTDTVTRTFAAWAFHTLDVGFAWMIGVVRGIQDVAQTLDWDNCKLPVVDTGMRSYGLCACGDIAHSIEESVKAKTWEHGAFWCSGFLMLNEADGSDLLVWNPFSLAELLRSKSPDGDTVDEYLKCLRDVSASKDSSFCAKLRPARDALEQQGVEVMQVVARCRANYQQARWDEASTLYALFPWEVWSEVGRDGSVPGEKLEEASWSDDRWKAVRRAMLLAMENAGAGDAEHRRLGLLLNSATWTCLDDALNGGALVHSCWRLASLTPTREFSYAKALSENYADIDSCMAFSGPEWKDGIKSTGALAQGLPSTMWSGSSTTREPVARLHPVVQGEEDQLAGAIAELQKYVEENIETEFERIGDGLREALEKYLSVEIWSVEGDSLHQLVDCVFIGPYATAELAHNVHDGGPRLPTPLYHRGLPVSRAFSTSGDTGGSDARKAFVRQARVELANNAKNVVVGEAFRHFSHLRSRWLGGIGTDEKDGELPRGVLCACDKPGEIWEHITYTSAKSLTTMKKKLEDLVVERWGSEPGRSFGDVEVNAMELEAGERFEFGMYVKAREKIYQSVALKASITCCKGQVEAGRGRADISFAADVEFERSEWDIGASFEHEALSQLSESGVWMRMLNGENWAPGAGEGPGLTAAYKADALLSDDERARLREAQLFANKMPVRAYDETEQELGGEPLWQACNGRVAGLHATLPWTRLGEGDSADGVIQEGVIQEGREAADILDAVFEKRVGVSGMHALEQAVEKLLTRAHALSPGFYTHAHRYVPSSSVWCEKDAAARGASAMPPQPPPKPATARWDASDDILDGLDATEIARIVSPGPDKVLYPAGVLDHCACGWSAGGSICSVPIAACVGGVAALQQAPGAWDQDETAWKLLCGDNSVDATYNNRSALLLVLRVLRLDAERSASSTPAWATLCDAATPSTTWGLLDANDETAWYAGQTRTWSFDARRLASYGAGGLRLGLLASGAPQKLSAFTKQFNLGGDLRDTFIIPDVGVESETFAHTVAQPVCSEHMSDYLAQNLDEYFADVLLPMAHSVQLGAGAACGRWAIEVAIKAALARGFAAGDEKGQQSLAMQAEVADIWEARCVASAHSAGICALRGVLADGAAPSSARSASALPSAHCAFAGGAHQVSGCGKHFYTPDCLLNCDGQYYEPCLCEADTDADGEGAVCEARVFDPTKCRRGRVSDARSLADSDADVTFMLSSMRWPSSIDPREAVDAADWENLEKHLQRVGSTASPHSDAYDEGALYDRASAWLLKDDSLSDSEEEVHRSDVNSHCDDLHDYWPDAQHPVGYHPTTACRRKDTFTRGFATWMSRDEAGKNFVDPMRMRNATRASQAFGAAHLVCDAHAYAAPGVELNPYYMRTRWNRDARADPAVPREAPPLGVDDMLYEGVPSFDASDSTLRPSLESESDALMNHSLGLVRNWARWIAEGAPRSVSQKALDDKWPHLVDEDKERSPKFLSRHQNRPAGCLNPQQFYCYIDSDCANGFLSADLVCLLNFAEPPQERRGICARKGSCYQHHHCDFKTTNKMCSGEGECVQPFVRVSNKALYDIEFQLFSPKCTVDTRRLGRYEAIPDFARANGMCSFRDWFHYHNATSNGSATANGLLEVPNGVYHRTDWLEEEEKTLLDYEILAHSPHACDLTYQHTDFKACSVEKPAWVRLFKSGAMTTAAQSMNATRTWVEKEGEWRVRFCDMPGDNPLDPYHSAENKLKSTTWEIHRCKRFKTCPKIPFALRGVKVRARRVRVHTSAGEQAYAREYCSLDAMRCGAFGYLNVNDCARAGSATKCVVDHWVLPLIGIVFGDDVDSADSQLLQKLREQCPYAFVGKIDGLENTELFSKMRETLLDSYDYTDKKKVALVGQMANGLLFAVFGVGVTGERDTKRGLSHPSSDETPHKIYVQQATCASYIAEKLVENERKISDGGKTFSYVLNDDRYITPGSSLYLFSKRVSVFVPIRWLMQCVIWAKDSEDEGGVHAGWVTQVIGGRIAEAKERERCQNWIDGHGKIHQTSITLKKRLLTANTIFVESGTTDNQVWSQNEIASDITDAVILALDQLGARSLPDLWCWKPDLLAFTLPTSKVPVSEVISKETSIRTALFDLDMNVETFKKNDDRPDLSIHYLVRQWLLNGKIIKNKDGTKMEWTMMTRKDLLDANVVVERNPNLEDLVYANETHWSMFEFKRLAGIASEGFAADSPDTFENYVDMSSTSKCRAKYEGGTHQLKNPEFEVKGDAFKYCSTPGSLLMCETLTQRVSNYDTRKTLPKPFLRRHELLSLVLVLVERAMHDSLTGGLSALHIPREGSIEINKLFQDPAVGDIDDDPLDIEIVAVFEEAMTGLSEASVECTASDDVDYQVTTNRQHEKLAQCLVDLREEVGWVIPKNKMAVSTIQIPVSPEMLIEGIFPAFMQKLTESNAQSPTGENAHLYGAEYFLSDLTGAQDVKDSPTDLRVCFARVASEAEILDVANVKKITPMHPFWGEFLDVAHSGNLVLEHSATGCDLKRSGEDNSLMIFSTLCGETPGGGQQVCSRHPEYLKALQTELPEACESLDGKVVNRELIGAMKSTPLCERRPNTGESECQRQHGLMNGRQGTPVGNLGGVSDVTTFQEGLWEESNSLFRGRDDDDLSNEATALKLFEHDIGGHALHFIVSAEGVLRLESVFMKSSPPETSRYDVREWLNRVEDDFADNHIVVERAMPVELPDTSWRCPLHWLQTFSNDGPNDDDARAPVPTRNQARFGHITKQNHFAHPTVLGSKKITNLRAARFLSDGLACVGTAAECHGRGFLSTSLKSLLGKQNEWQTVSYEGSNTCGRVLDWPEKDLELQGRP